MDNTQWVPFRRMTFLSPSNADEQIFVSKTPLFSAEECAKVIDWAEAEGKA